MSTVTERPEVAAALETIGATEIMPGVFQARLSTGQLVVIEEPAVWTTCAGCGDLMAAAPGQDRCEWCEVGR